ncbi:MAG: sulfatase [Balneolaceae bacterium]|nr:sulfatase [Balneolaceae bacterium]
MKRHKRKLLEVLITNSLLSILLIPLEIQSQSLDQPKMNVVVLVSDDQRWDALGAAGNDIIHTPRLDQLADEGVRFTNAYVTTSICMTSRASILTGQYMSRNNITQFGVEIEPDAFAKTYTGLLRDKGYWSGFVGKYGVGQARESDFDFLRSYQGRHWIEDEDGERIHVTEKNTLDSIEFLRERPKDRPFLLSLSYFAPHAEDPAPEQYLPQEWSAEYYEGVTIPPSPLNRAEYVLALPEFIRQEANEARVRYNWRFDSPERYQEYMTNYFRLITEVDESVGRLIDELREQGVYDNTLIIFIGDNGYFHADRGLADKWYPYEESIRVPLLIHDPRLTTGGEVRDEMALNIDLAPTIISAAGFDIPDVIQGKDLAQLYLSENPPDWRDEFFYEHPTITYKSRIPSSEAVVRLDMKYVYWPEWEYEQLFDLESDPTEKKNLIHNHSYTEELQIMREKLMEWRERVK